MGRKSCPQVSHLRHNTGLIVHLIMTAMEVAGRFFQLEGHLVFWTVWEVIEILEVLDDFSLPSPSSVRCRGKIASEGQAGEGCDERTWKTGTGCIRRVFLWGRQLLLACWYTASYKSCKSVQMRWKKNMPRKSWGSGCSVGAQRWELFL